MNAQQAVGMRGIADVTVRNQYHNTSATIRVPLGRIYNETNPERWYVMLTSAQWYGLRRRLCGLGSECHCMAHHITAHLGDQLVHLIREEEMSAYL